MKSKAKRRLYVAAYAGAAFIVAATIAHAASSGGGGSTPDRPEATSAEPSRDEAQEIFDRGMQLVKEGKFEDARERFEKAVSKKKNDPDYLNMLAYTQRKTGDLEDAFKNYEKALGQRPKFPQAREYLGEAHLQAALLQIEILRGYGAEGQKELDELTAALQRAASTMKPEAMAAGTEMQPVNPGDW
jgi:tetratricopeptide (TPR) repeat protein